jgi:Na+-driven multidrug efflux pump
VLDILLIPKFGIAGASVATIIAYGITSLYLIYAAKKHLLFSWKDILLLQKNDIRWLLSKSSSSH